MRAQSTPRPFETAKQTPGFKPIKKKKKTLYCHIDLQSEESKIDEMVNWESIAIS